MLHCGLIKWARSRKGLLALPLLSLAVLQLSCLSERIVKIPIGRIGYLGGTVTTDSEIGNPLKILIKGDPTKLNSKKLFILGGLLLQSTHWHRLVMVNLFELYSDWEEDNPILLHLECLCG